MNKKFIALLVSLFTVGASASVFAGGACCPTDPGADGARAASPARMMLTSYEKISNALAADDLAEAQAAARTMAAVADITGTKLNCPIAAKSDCDSEKKGCATAKEECEVAKQAAGGDKECRHESADGCTRTIQALIEAGDLKDARAHFKLISAQAIPLAEQEEGYFIMNCGMAGEGANWLQSDREVRNPYHGKSMLRCGKVKEASASTGASRSDS